VEDFHSRVVVAEALRPFGRPEEVKHTSLDAVTRGLKKTVTEAISSYVIVIYKV
jgi:hypothetical protein